jgi:hypothetical protein
LGGSLLIELTWLKIELERLYRDAYSYSFYLFNPGKMMLVPGSSQPDKSGNCGSMSALNLSASSRRTSRSEAPLDQPAAILTTNSKMSNIFLHKLQTIDLVREEWHSSYSELWKY